MRVVAGRLRGRRLQGPAGATTRPVPDRVREALFSMLGHRFGTPGALPELEVLDLFAGSGALGIEALSRGARFCLFVERARGALRVLGANLDRLGLRPVARVLAENAWTLRVPADCGPSFGLLFVDPPYQDVLPDAGRALALLERLAGRVGAGGLVVFRLPARMRFPAERLRRLSCQEQRSFGTTRLLLLAPAPTPADG